MIKTFPKIFTIGTNYILDIFKEPVEITEKIDGSQFNFGKIDGELVMFSKGNRQFAEKPDKLFDEAVNYIVSIQDRLPDNTMFHAEYLRKPHHNTLTYDRTPKNHLILFGVSDTTDAFDDRYFLWAEKLDIEAVPILYEGMVNNADELMAFLERQSILGNTTIEGVVVKNYQRKWLIGGYPMPIMCGKFVSEKFKEKHGKEWKTGKNKLDAFFQSFRTEARWLKSIQHLRDDGQLEYKPRDIGKLIKAIQEDIVGEERVAIMEFLYNLHKPKFLRIAIAGFPEWYKEWLMKRSFENDNPPEDNQVCCPRGTE